MKKIFIIFFILTTITEFASAQFYNGLQMNFGKNRVQYKNFEWRYYSYKNYDIFFYDRDVNLGKYVAQNIKKIMSETENFFGINLNGRILFIVYANLTDFRQANAGLDPENTNFDLGGKYQMVDNKVFLYYQGDHQLFERQVRELVATLYITQILYGNAFTELLGGSSVLNVPQWFDKGLASFVSKQYDENIINKTKDFIKNHKHINFNYLVDDDAKIIGHSFWYFISDTYGEQTISNILYFTKISKSVVKSISYVLGKNMKTLTKDWKNYYVQKTNTEVVLPKSENEILKSKKHRVFQQLKISPDGKNIAFVENYEGRYKVLLYNSETDKTKRLYKEGHRLDQIVDYTYPVLAWSDDGKKLAFAIESKGNVNIKIYETETKKITSGILQNIDKVMSMSFSPRNLYLVISGISSGYTDLFVYNRVTSTSMRLTYDLADDLDPHFTKDGKKIVFSSNRSNDTLIKITNYLKNYPLNDNFDLYVYDFKNKSKILTKLTNNQFSNETNPINLTTDQYLFLSDNSGIKNNFFLQYDSTISFVDTTVHYRHFSDIRKVSNYTYPILEYDLNGNYAGDLFFYDKKYHIYQYHRNELLNKNIKFDSKPDFFKKKEIENKINKLAKEKEEKLKRQNQIKKLDSLAPTFDLKINAADSSIVDINNYVFEMEKDTLFAKYYKNRKEEGKSGLKKSPFPKMRVYKPLFFINDVLGQVDFSMLNQSYQPFSGSAFKFNNGMAYFMSISLDELMDDYKLIGGFRFGLNGSIEYLLSAENLKKRLDKQLIFHRQRIKYTSNSNFYPPERQKTVINELMYVMRYPFNQISSVKTTFIAKYDQKIPLSTEYNTLISKDTLHLYTGFKTEYIFDNTKILGMNLLDGTRFKIFGEFYQQVEGNYDYTGVLGADFRFYKNIFRHFTLAQRFAGATSFGSGKVIFYLGGVDNWINLSLKQNGYFDYRVNINYAQNYLFQAVATNLRGFPQNARNGNSFLVSNTELRMPIVQMILPYPVNSDFWNNLQVVGFFDIGSAWAGLSPYDPKNKFNQIVVRRQPFTVIVDVDRPPFVFGYGWGLRSKLLGYFVRLDFAWGVEARYHYPRKVYLSLAKDF